MRGKTAATSASDRGLIAVMLWLGRLVAPLLVPFGVDRQRFLILLATRVRVDLRRGARAKQDGKPQMYAGSLALTVFTNLLLGLLLGLLVADSEQPLAGLFAMFAFTMCLTTATLMTDHASTLLETTDLQVLGPLPVDGRTVLAARVCHTLLWFLLLIGSLGVFPLAFGIGTHGFWPFAPVFVLALVSSTVTCLALALIILVLALRVASPTRVRSWLLAVQIAASLAVVVSYQVLPLLRELRAEWLTTGAWWSYLLPPAHAAALVAWAIAPGNAPLGHVVLALGAPLLMLWLVSRAAPRFQERLLGMAAADRDLGAPPRRRPFRDLLLRDREAVAGYDFAAAMVARDRTFRMRSWPPVAMAWFFAAWIIWRTADRGGGFAPEYACVALYLIAVSTPQVLTLARFADDWAARWLFVASPLRNAANFVAGSQLALALRFVAPAALLTAVLILGLGGLELWPDVAWSLLVVAEVALLTLQLTEHRMLFCEKFETAAVQGSVMRGLLYLMLGGMLLWPHLALRGQPGTFRLVLAGFAAFVLLHGLAILTGMRQRPPMPVRFRGGD